MRKLLAATALATAGLAAGPIAGASADLTFKDPDCAVYGTATFDNPLTGTLADNTYRFNSSPTGTAVSPTGTKTTESTICSGTVNDIKFDKVPVRVAVVGSGKLSCATSTANDGVGTVTFLSNNLTVPFKLDIVGFGTEVSLTVKGDKSGSDSGTATFRNDDHASPPEAATTCAGGGYRSLTFSAAFKGSDPLVSSGNLSSGGGGSGGGGGSTGGGGGGSTGGGGGGGSGSAPVATRFSFQAAAQKLKTALTKGIAVTLKGNAPARADLKGQVDKATAKRYGLGNGKKPVVVAIGRIALTHAGQAKGYLKLTSPAKRKLKNAKNVKVTLVGTVSDATRHQTKVNKTVLLR